MPKITDCKDFKMTAYSDAVSVKFEDREVAVSINSNKEYLLNFFRPHDNKYPKEEAGLYCKTEYLPTKSKNSFKAHTQVKISLEAMQALYLCLKREVEFNYFMMNAVKKKEMLNLWFDYLLANKKHWCNGFTLKRLNKAKNLIFSDNHIVYDLLERHGAIDLTPEEMKLKSLDFFNHAIGNFACSISNLISVLKDEKKVRPKKPKKDN